MLSLDQAKLMIEDILLKYKQYENIKIDAAPRIGTTWSPAYGFLKICTDTIVWEYSFPRKILIGIQIGSKFANYDKKVLSDLKSEVKQVLSNFSNNQIIDIYGSAYSTFGLLAD